MMKAWQAVGLIRRSGIGSAARAELFASAVRRMAVAPGKEHVFALRLSAGDALRLAGQIGVELTMPDLVREGVVGSDADFRLAAKTVPATVRDVFALPLDSIQQARLMEDMGMTVSIDELARHIRARSLLYVYKRVLAPKPELPDLVRFFQHRNVTDYFLKNCAEFGAEPTVGDALATASLFCDRVDLYRVTEAHGLVIPTGYLLQQGFEVPVLVRHMWRTACRDLFYSPLPVRYSASHRVQLNRARRAVRCIQRFARWTARSKAARVIQAAWRRSVSDPARVVGKRRLLREFDELRSPKRARRSEPEAPPGIFSKSIANYHDVETSC